MISMSTSEYGAHINLCVERRAAIYRMGIDVASQMLGKENVRIMIHEANFRERHRSALAVVPGNYRIAVGGPAGVGGFVDGSFSNPHATDSSLDIGSGWTGDVVRHENKHMEVQIHAVEITHGLSSEQVQGLRRRAGSAVDMGGVQAMEGLNEWAANGKHTQSGYKGEVSGMVHLAQQTEQLTGRSILSEYNNGNVTAIHAIFREAASRILIEEEIQTVAAEQQDITTPSTTSQTLEDENIFEMPQEERKTESLSSTEVEAQVIQFQPKTRAEAREAIENVFESAREEKQAA